VLADYARTVDDFKPADIEIPGVTISYDTIDEGTGEVHECPGGCGGEALATVRWGPRWLDRYPRLPAGPDPLPCAPCFRAQMAERERREQRARRAPAYAPVKALSEDAVRTCLEACCKRWNRSKPDAIVLDGYLEQLRGRVDDQELRRGTRRAVALLRYFPRAPDLVRLAQGNPVDEGGR